VSKVLKTLDPKADVVIVGGGMIGLSLALMLAKKSVVERIVVFEERPFSPQSASHQQYSFDDRSTAISAGSVQLLTEIDVWSSLSVYAQAIRKVKVSDKHQFGSSEYGQSVAADRAMDYSGSEALGWVVENRYFGDCLKSAVENEPRIDVFAPAKVEKIQPKRQGAQLHVLLEADCASEAANKTAKAAVIDTSLLVLADGAESSLAAGLGITFNRHDYKQRALIANVAHSKPHHGVAFEHFTERGPLAFLPLPDHSGMHRSAVVWTHENQAFEHVEAWDDEKFCAELQSVFSSRLGELTHVGKRNQYSLQLTQANEQVRSHTVLLGNAAHFLHPVAGQGFNLGLRDAAMLVRALMAGKQQGRSFAAFDDLQRYAKSRENDQWLTTTMSHQFVSLFTGATSTKRIARTVALSSLNKLPPLKSAFFSQMMGQGLNKVSLR